MSTAIVWFRRDLRIHDHPALCAALEAGERVVPVFCLDDGLLKGRHASGPRTQFLLQCLANLDVSLRERGSRLFVRHGRPDREIAKLARAFDAGSVHFSADVSPFARARQEQVATALKADGIAARAHPGLFAVDRLRDLTTGAGKAYTVFTPFYRNWESQPRRDVHGAPNALPDPG
ncbi:MAG TPA: deoxyribodipyrimidine photo-lyase, partial [Solirubrobacteraceae bacterium]